MKKFNRGFTIAEVATAMAIVGVVAAITIPMLHKNIQKQVYAATLARTTEQIELGCQNLFEYENSKRKDGSAITMLSQVEGDVMKKLAPFIGLSESYTNSGYINNIVEYAYLPAYTLGSPVYAAVSAEDDKSHVETLRTEACTHATSDLENGLGLDYIENCSGGGGGSGSTTPALPDDSDDTDIPPVITEKEPIPILNTDTEPDPEDNTDTNPEVTTTESEDTEIKINSNTVYRSASGKQEVIFINNKVANEPTDTLLEFVIDTNGTKSKTNMYGKDVFKFELQNNGKVKPYGNADDCKIGDVGNGQACAARVVADGWKIKY